MRSMLSTVSKPEKEYSSKRLDRANLHDYQCRAVEFIKSTNDCALWVEMGLGKTVSVLTAVSDLISEFEAAKVLVVAPLRVARTTWPAEVSQWEHTKHLTVGVIKGDPAQRQWHVAHDTSDIHVINRELVTWLVKFCQENKNWPYDMVVLDESSSFKSHKSQRFKALRKALPYVSRMVELTGTPASNGLLDVWSQVFLLDRGERLGRTFTKYRNTYFEGDYMGYNFAPKRGAEEKIYEKLEDVCLTLRAEDYLRLPKRVDNIVEVHLGDSEMAAYRELEREFLLELDGGDTVQALYAATLANKLQQYANGVLYVGEEKKRAKVHDQKLQALQSIIEEAAGGPILVAYNFKSDAETIAAACAGAVLLDKDPETINRWNRGEIAILLAHPASAGHGLNLQKGGNIAVWYGLNWSLELYQQFNARLHRQGQTKPVVIHHLATKDTIDETVLAALARKDVTQAALLNALKLDIRQRLEI